jgi:hypothetical protein
MIDVIVDILKNSLSITFFVLTTMLFIEYINVRSSGTFNSIIQKNGLRQIILGAFLGVIPGCLGTYTMVTFYTHNIVTIGALTATFIATMGDEAFLLFSIQPLQAIGVFVVLFIIGIFTGVIVDLLYTKKKADKLQVAHFEIHETEQMFQKASFSLIINNIKHASPHRALLLFGIAIIFILSLLGQIGHSHDFLSSFAIQHASVEHIHNHDHEINWLAVTFVLLSIGAAYIVSSVNEHFLEEHFWSHIIQKHFIKIFSWTTLVLVIVTMLNTYIHIEDFLQTYTYHILFLAVLVGIIPESGPHIVFLSLYVSGTLPLSILMANSIVQDGHGALPLIAESKKTFLQVKFINIVVGLLVGIIGLQLGI